MREELSIDAGADAGDAAPPMPDADVETGPELRFEVLTASQRGRYAPRNIGAIWVEDAQGKFVRTLELWASLRLRYLRRFNQSSGGNTVDAITGATLMMHETHSVAWDFRDHTGRVVDDGGYKLVVEATDRDASGQSIELVISKGPNQAPPVPVPSDAFPELRVWLE